MIEKYKKFLLVFVGLLFCASVFYAGGFIWANTLENGTSGFYFTKNFLLENTKDRPRIIFDSGSNSHHSINSLMIEKELGLLTLNMAHHAGYPLDFILHKLAPFLNNKDVVILPLEYPYYSRDDKAIISDITNELPRHGKFYFNALPLNKKLFVLTKLNFTQGSIPFINAYFLAKHNLIGSHFNFDDKSNIDNLLKNGERGDINYTMLLNQGIDLSKVNQNKGKTCQESTEVEQLNPKFIQNIKLIKEIEAKTGARFIFTYPALAGDGCYDFSTPKGEKLKALIEQIKPLVESYGFLFIGNPFDSYFPNNMLNTYWHIDEKARDIRTKRLIEELKKTGLFNTNK
ncbi:hypothetical protein [Campylobacter sp.]|uniref:hypothetical protein n=1 Tax=Campylobacter sp. TaxID=205 RepID=UPI002AA81CDC|nr:hypothetical protein [Campylobacter sp.]MCI6661364.1 hypothetical protein [Campylobacter sp.]MCI7550563.1 hypothetical protein [Campylobacter sp.]